MEEYTGYIPCCGIYCGGCPHFKIKCGGADNHCSERRCGIYKCCIEKKELRFCYECKIFPCSKFRKFNNTWLKYGQDLIENQKYLQQYGIDKFRKYMMK